MTSVVILTAVLSYTMVPFLYNATGYQTSTVTEFTDMATCSAAGKTLLDTYKLGNIAPKEPDKGHIACTTLVNGEPAEQVTIFSKQ